MAGYMRVDDGAAVDFGTWCVFETRLYRFCTTRIIIRGVKTTTDDTPRFICQNSDAVPGQRARQSYTVVVRRGQDMEAFFALMRFMRDLSRAGCRVRS